MNCTDLMLDDWVLDTYTGKPMRVQYVDIKVGKGLEPIPLTPEILEKNGFEKDDGGEECWGCDAGWVIPGEYDECGKEKSWQVEILGEPNSFTGTIHFVHDLQHALRLCGIEKEIGI